MLRRVDLGESRRSLAREVFGDERFKGRVDRIVRGHELGGGRDARELLLQAAAAETGRPAQPSREDDSVPTLDELFPLYARDLRRRLEDPDERVSAAEMATFARLEYRLEEKRLIEQANAISRG